MEASVFRRDGANIFNSKFTIAEAYANNGELQTVELNFDNTTSTNFKLYQNVPNPFSNETFIGFDLPTASAATLTITDVSGKVVYRTKGNFAKGYNRIELTKNDLPTNGVWYYQLKTATDFDSGKVFYENYYKKSELGKPDSGFFLSQKCLLSR